VIVISVRAPSLRLDNQVNAAVLRFFARARTPWLTDVANGIYTAGSGWGATVLGLSAVVLTIVFRRWRHLLVFLCSLFALTLAMDVITEGMTRPRPYGVAGIAGWTGYSAPALSVTILTFLLMSIAYCLVVPGRPRSYAKTAIAVIVVVFCLVCLYLAVDHVDDLLLGVALAVAIPVSAFRFFTPNEIFPVAYRRGNTAHVDVTGARGEAIRQGVRDQLGLTVTGITPVGLESSAGSTPLRLQTEGAPQEYLFAKLYTKGHVRADRWYKIWRTILYGSLEDEHPFQTVRRLAEYEDYALRLLQDAGIAVPRPYGIVEITPEREYLLVTEYFDGAVEIGGADLDDQLIGQGLSLIRALWDAGIAHRDIKPGNLMVRAGQLLLIDVAFAQVRPSPWRQAVDLGNMMLVLAVRTDPARVYQQALNYFTEAELAEAFAATRGVASPTQLRAFMKRDPRDLLAEFRKLAPQRQPIVLQRWSVRRVTLAAAMLAIFAVSTVFGVGLLLPDTATTGVHVTLGAVPRAPDCSPGHTMILAAQAVPSAAFLPCIAPLPSGWTAAGPEIASGQASFVLNSGQAGLQAVTITLTATCDTAGAQQIPSDQPGMRRFERPLSLVPEYSGVRYYTFPGGCATYRFVLAPGASPVVTTTVDTVVAFMPRSALVGYVRRTEGLALCGRGAACPG
jgi:tRNA A-37 threonylcarbamoyl transferase component Bud32